MAISLVLKPYVSRRELGWFTRLVIGCCLVFLAAFYGLMCSILPLQLVAIPALPIIAMALMILWLLPDIGGLQDRIVGSALVAFVGFNAVWPSFVALNLPGLPWVTPSRFIVIGLVSVFAFNFATSAQMRSQVLEALNGVPLLRQLFWLFWGTTLVAMPFSDSLMFSISKFLNNQIFWTMMLLASAWLATREGFVLRISKVLAWTVILISLSAIYEYRVSDLFWLHWLPSWLKADDATFAKLGLGSARAGVEEYRARGPFGNSLYFAEYLAIALPFVIYYLTRAKRLIELMLLGAGAFAVLSAMLFTGSRSAMIGALLTLFIYAFLEALRVRQQRPGSLMANAVLFAYPVFAVALASLVIFWRRLHVMVIGGGQHQGSTDARIAQWEMGWPKVLSHPLGHGAGRSGDVLGFYNPGSENVTVDTYYLTLLLDYGFIGFLAFMALIGMAIWFGFRAYTKARSPETLLLAPIMIALTNFLIIKSAASTESHMPVIFILIGCLIALVRRQTDADMAAAPAVAEAVARGKHKQPVFARFVPTSLFKRG